jgi:demethylmenaquinone methyltransferase/2-methoxy-6-polyprenyl-1,4-benzoquinol methylase
MYKQSAPETIQALFASIATNYDKANQAFTFGLHKKWNQKLVDNLKGSKCLLDLCAGTGEIAFGFLKKNLDAEAILLDFCPEMLAVAQKKGSAFKGRFEIVQGDAQAVPLADNSVDGVSIAYGIRNVQDPAKCFLEVYRVLKPGGRFGILELTRPSSKFLRTGHKIYTTTMVPFLGRLAAKNREAYAYLVNSVAHFASPENLEASLSQVGFCRLRRTPLMGGVATLILTIK